MGEGAALASHPLRHPITERTPASGPQGPPRGWETGTRLPMGGPTHHWALSPAPCLAGNSG